MALFRCSSGSGGSSGGGLDFNNAAVAFWGDINSGATQTITVASRPKYIEIARAFYSSSGGSISTLTQYFCDVENNVVGVFNEDRTYTKKTMTTVPQLTITIASDTSIKVKNGGSVKCKFSVAVWY